METLTIGDVARRVGIDQSAIRFYERQGLLPRAARVSGWRHFQPQTVERLRAIHIARTLGFTLDEIRTLLTGFSPDTPPPERWQAMARAKIAEIDAYIECASAMKRLLQAGLTCQCLRIEDCFIEDCSKPRKQERALAVLSTRSCC